MSPATYRDNIYLPAGLIYQLANMQSSVWVPADKNYILDMDEWSVSTEIKVPFDVYGGVTS